MPELLIKLCSPVRQLLDLVKCPHHDWNHLRLPTRLQAAMAVVGKGHFALRIEVTVNYTGPHALRIWSKEYRGEATPDHHTCSSQRV